MKSPPETALQRAQQAHRQAIADLAAHQQTMRELRTRINELDKEIVETAAKAAETPSMAALSLEAIKALSATKSGLNGQMEVLGMARDEATRQLARLGREEIRI